MHKKKHNSLPAPGSVSHVSTARKPRQLSFIQLAVCKVGKTLLKLMIWGYHCFRKHPQTVHLDPCVASEDSQIAKAPAHHHSQPQHGVMAGG